MPRSIQTLICYVLPITFVACSGEDSTPVQSDDRGELPSAPAASSVGETDSPKTAAAPDVQSQGAGASGSVTHQGQTMTIEGGTAVWNPDDAKLIVTLLPFEPTEGEIERIRRDETFFAILDREKGIQGFEDRTPHAFISLSWPFEKGDIGNVDKASCHFYIGFLKESGSNMNLNFPASDDEKGPVTVTGEIEVGKEITLSLAGEDDLLGDSMSWDIRFKGPIQAAIGD